MLLLKLEQKMKHKRNYLLPYELKQKWEKKSIIILIYLLLKTKQNGMKQK